MIPKETKYNLHFMMYRKTFYDCHTAQHQLQYSKIKIKKDSSISFCSNSGFRLYWHWFFTTVDFDWIVVLNPSRILSCKEGASNFV